MTRALPAATGSTPSSTMKFVHSADVHLDSPLRGLDAYEGAPVAELRGATRQAFENLVSLCIDEQASLLLLAGDLYDGDWPDFNTGLYFQRQMARLDAAGIRVALLSGNHDAASRITKRLPIPRNVLRFSSRRPQTFLLEDLGVALHGQSFPQRQVTDNLAQQFPEPVAGLLNIGVLHTALDGRVGHDPYAPCTVSDLVARGYDYWALGHVHQREVLSENPWIVFCGCLQGRNVRELGPKGCSVVVAEEGSIARVESRHVDVLRWAVVAVEAGGIVREDELLEHIARALTQAKADAEGRMLAVRVRITGSTQLHERLLRARREHVEQVRALGIEVGGGEIWVEKVLVETTAWTSAARERRDDGIGELLAAIGDVLSADAVQEDLLQELEPVLGKLPADIIGDPELLNPRRREHMRELIARAQALLLARLDGAEGGS